MQNRYKSIDIDTKLPIDMLKFALIMINNQKNKRQLKTFLFLVLVDILNVGRARRTQFSIKSQYSQYWLNLVQRFQRIRFKCDIYENMHNLQIRYKSAERQMLQKTPEYKLNSSYQCNCC
jgi:hypothetical protein